MDIQKHFKISRKKENRLNLTRENIHLLRDLIGL